MKQRLTNTWKHAAVGSLVGLVGAMVQIQLRRVPNTQAELGWFIFLAAVIAAIWFEMNQFKRMNEKRKDLKLSPISAKEYLKAKWLDCVCDVVVAVVCCALVMLVLGAL